MSHIDHHILELLAPAKDLEGGKDAILCGADAVYIGAPRFGARAEAGNSLEEIATLVTFAHSYHCKVYVALNTILYENEVEDAIRLAHQIYNVGADALIIQDLALLSNEMPPIPLHASTQMDNVDISMIRFRSSLGIEQLVLARELTQGEIAEIHAQVPNIRLEAFVHGALCVSYSGRCYASASRQVSRSANRGSCAQICRLPYDLIDGAGNTLVRNKHLLSLKDLNRGEVLPDLIQSGVSSFKIEGRLKDRSYVRTVTKHYDNLLNDFIHHHPEYRRYSPARSSQDFTADLSASFNRGFTDFTHAGRIGDEIAGIDTPKSMGPLVGKVKSVGEKSIHLTPSKGVSLANGDGFSYFLSDGSTAGFRANTVQEGIIYPNIMPAELKPGTPLYRSYNISYEREVMNAKVERLLPIVMRISGNVEQVRFSAAIQRTNVKTSLTLQDNLSPARKSQGDVIRECLTKTGGTPYEVVALELAPEVEGVFIPKSRLTEVRRILLQDLGKELPEYMLSLRKPPEKDHPIPLPTESIDYTANVSNPYAKSFYLRHGALRVDPAFELSHSIQNPVMYTKYCIRYEIRRCPHYHHYTGPQHDPWILLNRERDLRLRLEFDCPRCRMIVYDVSEV